jgi:hypothetical protein
MKKLLLMLIILTSLITPVQKAQALDAKGKAFLVICTYGTVGGALLGFASMAFGTNSRAIAQGASLGLYAGIAFGSYVVASHGNQGVEVDPAYDQPQGPPPGFDDGYGAPPQDGGGQGFGAPPPRPDEGGGFFGGAQRSSEITEDLIYNYRLKNKKGRGLSLPMYINFVNTTF